MKVTIYSTTSCPYCHDLKELLTNNNVLFEEKLIDQDEEARNKMAELSGGFMGVPYVVIEKENGSVEKVIGYDKKRISGILSITN